MKVRMPDGQVISVPDGVSKAEVAYFHTQSKLNDEYTPGGGDLPLGLSSPTMISAGKTITDMGRGLESLYQKGAGLMTDTSEQQAALRAEQSQADQQMQPLQESNPYQVMAGQALPGLATMPLSGGLLPQVAIGAGMGGIRGANNQGGQAITEGVLSGMGYGAGKGLSSILQMAKGGGKRVGGEAGRLLDRADELGFYTMPGQRTGSRPMQQLDVTIKRSPHTSSLVEEGLQNNQKTLNRLALEAIGETGDEIGVNTLGDAFKRIGGVYDDVAAGVDEMAVPGLDDFSQMMSPDSIPRFKNYTDRFPGLLEGRLTGDEFSRLRQIVAKDLRGLRNNPTAGNMEDLALFDDLLMQGLEEAAPGSKDILRTAGQQYRIAKALEGGQAVTKTNVNPRSFASQLNKFDKRLKRGGETDELSNLYDGVRLSNQFSDIVGDSGTPTGMWAQTMMNQETVAGMAKAYGSRKLAERYLETGGGRVPMALMGAFKGSPGAAQAGAAVGRGGLLND